ncbi:MAG: Uma2 family endonuclease [Chloroflexi bacterium]|nr:Uma2 family endonuclease [Chloroflexota bacterium]
MSALLTPKYSVEEYLALERESDIRHEYYDGEIFTMTGGSENHVLVTGNTLTTLNIQLRQRPCKIYATDMRVRVGPSGLYTYPDLAVVCGAAEFTKENPPSLLNPIPLIEVPSPSTEAYDRGKKFQHYRKLESLREVVLIAQDSARSESYWRQDNGQWLLSEAAAMEATLTPRSIDCVLALADVYEKVTFEVNNES